MLFYEETPCLLVLVVDQNLNSSPILYLVLNIGNRSFTEIVRVVVVRIEGDL